MLPNLRQIRGLPNAHRANKKPLRVREGRSVPKLSVYYGLVSTGQRDVEREQALRRRKEGCDLPLPSK